MLSDRLYVPIIFHDAGGRRSARLTRDLPSAVVQLLGLLTSPGYRSSSIKPISLKSIHTHRTSLLLLALLRRRHPRPDWFAGGLPKHEPLLFPFSSPLGIPFLSQRANAHLTYNLSA
jgi:hypothetical protein